MTFDQANDLAVRTLAAIEDRHDYGLRADVYADHQERVASDLRLLTLGHSIGAPFLTIGGDVIREAKANLRRTAALYGVVECMKCGKPNSHRVCDDCFSGRTNGM